MRRFVHLLFALLLGSCAQAVDIDSLLVASIGGTDARTTLAGLQSYRTEGSANLNGLTGEYTQVFAAPDRFYIEIRIGGMTLVQAYDGTTAWKRDHNGRVSEVEGMERRQLLTQVYLASYSFVLPDRLPGGAGYLGDTTSNDTTWLQAAIYPFGTDTIIMLLDPGTAEPEVIVERMDNLTAVTRASDYRSVGGIRMAHRARTDFREVPLFTEMITRSVELDVEVDPTLFGMPTAALGTVDFRFSGGADSVVIPFKYHRGHIWLQATVNGSMVAWFILDSGASANMFNAPAVAPLNLSQSGSLPAVGLGGVDEIPLVRTDSVTIGSLTLLNQIGGIIDLAAIGIQPPAGATAGGLLGHDFLSRFPVLIDYRDSTLTVYDPATYKPPDGGTALDFHLTLLVPTVRASVNGIEGDFIIDLGNSVGLVLHNQFYRSRGLDTVLTDIQELDRSLTGVGGDARTLSATVPRFRLGNIQLENLPTIIPESTQGLSGSEELAGNIGNLVLERFRVLLDYTESRIYLYPPSTP